MWTRDARTAETGERDSAAAGAVAQPGDVKPAEIELFAHCFKLIVGNVEKVIRGKPEAVSLALVALFAEGHLLIEDVPGVGKTSLARCIARSVDTGCQRIQFTADLLPSDVTGGMVLDQRTGEFAFRPGPIFTNIVIADEINRASPKAQSALLEVMEERRVSADGRPRPVPSPFMVVATENPIDMAGTYPLPEAQLDRFMLRISIGHPDLDAEVELMRDRRRGIEPEQLEPVVTGRQMLELVDIARRVETESHVLRYIAGIVAATRTRGELRHGASPRGSIALVRAAQVWAATQERSYVNPDDVKALAEHVLAHRVVLSPAAELEETRPERVIRDVLATVPVPRRPAAG